MSDDKQNAARAAWSFFDNMKSMWSMICAMLPVLALSLFEYEESRVDRLKKENESLQLDLTKKENVDAIQKKYDGLSDLDVVKQAISDGGGTAVTTGVGSTAKN